MFANIMKKRALLISCFNWYQSRLAPVRQLLLSEYDVTVLIADFDHISKQKITKRYSECTYIKVPKYKKNISLSRIRSHLVFGKAVHYYLRKLQPKLIFLQIPPNNSARYCLEYKQKNPNVKYYIDLIDLWPESMPLERVSQNFVLGYWKKIRNDSLKAADHVFTECRLYQDKLKYVLNSEKTSVLYLFKNQTEEEKIFVEELIASRDKKHENTLSFAYLGSINNIIDMEGIGRVLKAVKTKGIKASIHVIGDGERKEQFLKVLENTGANVYYYGPIYDQIKKIQLLAGCDYGFNMMKRNISVGLTIKSIEYFSMSLPIINNIKGDTWEMVEKYNVGLNWRGDDDIENMMTYNLSEAHKMVRNLYAQKFTENIFTKTVDIVLKKPRQY